MMKSPLAMTSPPPISLAMVRALVMKHRRGMPPELLLSLRTQLVAQGLHDAARELEEIFDLETGRPR